MFGEHHTLAYRSKEESKFVFKLSFRQFVWYLIGGVVSSKLAAIFPPIPHVGFLFRYMPEWIPFGVCVLFAHMTHLRTGLSLWDYVRSWAKCRIRKRVFVK